MKVSYNQNNNKEIKFSNDRSNRINVRYKEI